MKIKDIPIIISSVIFEHVMKCLLLFLFEQNKLNRELYSNKNLHFQFTPV